MTEFHRLRKYGIRVWNKRRIDQYGQEYHQKIKEHRMDHWLERDPARKVNLVHEQRFKLGASVNKYFVPTTKIEASV